MANRVNNGGDDPPAQQRLLREYTTSGVQCTVVHRIDSNHTTFRNSPNTIQLLPSFHGKEEEKPYHHLKTFFTICSTFNYGGVSEEQIRH
ncbi:unnamed protein product [Prunus armeniaca]|uniref:Uncharacterized protein n=1 Tax=Prunus armeniaca TaxID=36596 RepID=A0A6J5URW2_PRUAR|nr:unnamed protein product [Prunus armeniaca]